MKTGMANGAEDGDAVLMSRDSREVGARVEGVPIDGASIRRINPEPRERGEEC